MERFELLSTANELRQQLRQYREGAAALARSAETSPVVGTCDSFKRYHHRLKQCYLFICIRGRGVIRTKEYNHFKGS